MPKVWVVDGRLAFRCPGCKEVHDGWNVGAVEGRPRWTWNGDEDRPTLSPSLIHKIEWSKHKVAYDVPTPDVVCHSYIRDGRIQFLGDCTHDLAGRTVGLPEVYEGALLELKRLKRASGA